MEEKNFNNQGLGGTRRGPMRTRSQKRDAQTPDILPGKGSNSPPGPHPQAGHLPCIKFMSQRRKAVGLESHRNPQFCQIHLYALQARKNSFKGYLLPTNPQLGLQDYRKKYILDKAEEGRSILIATEGNILFTVTTKQNITMLKEIIRVYLRGLKQSSHSRTKNLYRKMPYPIKDQS